MGLSRARQGFAALPAVETELEKIEAAVPSRVFLNDGFTRRRVQAQMEETPFPVVHLATHGQFSSRAEDTFLLTWDDRINVRDLDRLLRRSQGTSAEPVELLVLSACQTATGDRQAALGLAGVAVRSGARSTIATLWQVNDISTAAFMAEFYRQLAGPGVGKAQALRQAQLSLLREPRYRDPYYWAAFVLIGNWL
jgi:CHAT domain-containing protein